MVFDVKAITAQSITLFGDFKMAFGFNLTTSETGGFGGDDRGDDFFVVSTHSFGEDCFNLDGVQSSILTCGGDLLDEGAGSLVVS